MAAVCREWHSVMKEVTWKELSWKHGRGLVQELGFDEKTVVPPGGWLGFYKLLTYCPGLHFGRHQHPRENAGHVEEKPECFCKGPACGEDGIYLASHFAQDEVVRSHLCSFHDSECRACRGIVKHFARSNLARVTGAAAYFHGEKAETVIQSASQDWKCPYCNSLCFELNRWCDFSLVLDDHDESGSEEDLDKEIATGFVCVSGHIILQLAGFPKDKGDVVPLSGDGLILERSPAGMYWSRHLFGKSYRKRQHSIPTSIGVSELINVEDRLNKLQKNWPTKTHPDGVCCYRTFDFFGTGYGIRASDADVPQTIIDVLESGLPVTMSKCLHKHILEGEPSLSEVMVMLLNKLKRSDDSRAKLEKGERTYQIRRALRKEGFELNAVPHQQSVETYIQGSDALTIKEVVLEQQLAQEPDEEKRVQIRLEAKGKVHMETYSDSETSEESNIVFQSNGDSEVESSSDSEELIDWWGEGWQRG